MLLGSSSDPQRIGGRRRAIWGAPARPHVPIASGRRSSRRPEFWAAASAIEPPWGGGICVVERPFFVAGLRLQGGAAVVLRGCGWRGRRVIAHWLTSAVSTSSRAARRAGGQDRSGCSCGGDEGHDGGTCVRRAYRRAGQGRIVVTGDDLNMRVELSWSFAGWQSLQTIGALGDLLLRGGRRDRRSGGEGEAQRAVVALIEPHESI